MAASCSPEMSQPAAIRTSTKAGLGTYLVDGSGRALYRFSADAEGVTACLGHCATIWRPVHAKKVPEALETSLARARFSVLSRPDSVLQLAVDRLPLYYYENDRKPGDTGGHTAMSFGGRFSLVSPSGKPLDPR